MRMLDDPTRKLRWILLAVIVALAVHWLSRAQDSSDLPAESNGKVLLDTEVEPDVRAPDYAAEVTSIDDVDFKIEDAATCLTSEQLESHPVLVEDSYRFDSVSITGPTIASYRGLSISVDGSSG